MDNIFTKVQMTKPQRSMFDLSHDVKLSMNFGYLYPVWTRFCMPGDKFNVSQEALIRALPLVAPVMHMMNVTIHTFFVPCRLLWNEWGDYFTNTKVGGPPAILPTHPFLDVNSTNYAATKLMDYMGIPEPIGGNTERINALPFAAYQKIYNEYYRDQNLIQAEVDECVGGNNDPTTYPGLYTLRKRAWKHDYFTSNLPFAQKGDAVSMPFNFNDVAVKQNFTLNPVANIQWALTVPAATNTLVDSDTPVGPVSGTDLLYAQTSALAGSSTMNDLRTAEALQKWLERAARGGSRPTEWILSMYGVRSSDARLQRPEYVNGSVTPIMISEVLNTSDTATAPQGNMSGHGVSRVNGRSSGYFCEEFGYMMSILSIMPETAYQQGIEKSLWLRINDPSELPNPLFAQLGEQETKVKEIFAFDATSNDLFGYLPRFAEDRFENSRVAGQMRTSLDFWHLAQIYAVPPALNQTFIECTPSYRIFAVTDDTEDHFVAHVYNRVTALRCLPKYNNPSIT